MNAPSAASLVPAAGGIPSAGPGNGARRPLEFWECGREDSRGRVRAVGAGASQRPPPPPAAAEWSTLRIAPSSNVYTGACILPQPGHSCILGLIFCTSAL